MKYFSEVTVESAICPKLIGFVGNLGVAWVIWEIGIFAFAEIKAEI